MKILITGATGVIGKRIVPLLTSAGHDVTAVSRSAEKAARLERAGARPVALDLFDITAIESAVKAHDVIINLATAIPRSSRALLPGAWRMTNRIRREVPRLLAQAAQRAGVRRLIQESFAPVYPDRGEQWLDESTPIAPARYNRGVADAETAVAAFTAAGGEGVVLRFAFFYGPDSDFTRDMIGMVKKGFAPMPGRRDAFVSSVAHEDAASAVFASLLIPAGVYNVCDDEPVTHRQFFTSLAESLGVRMPRFAPAWTTHLLGSLGETLSRSQRMANHKLRGVSPWRPAYASVRDGWPAVISALQA